MPEVELPCGCKIQITYTHTCKEDTERLLLSHMGGDGTIDKDDVEWLMEKAV